ncbi:hypothetical protein BGZ76_011376 [Entomortierella beljakovae]|nr:hypothetical protein BGZ76_011376 [Entomortierella beljakovae]
MSVTTSSTKMLNNSPCKQCFSNFFAARSIVDLYKYGKNRILQSLPYSRFADLYSAESLLYRVWLVIDPILWIAIAKSLIQIISLAYMAIQWDIILLFAAFVIMILNPAVFDRKAQYTKPMKSKLKRIQSSSNKNVDRQSEIAFPDNDGDASIPPQEEFKEFEPESARSLATIIQGTYKEQTNRFSFKTIRWNKKTLKGNKRSGSLSSIDSSSSSSSSSSSRSQLSGPTKIPDKKMFQFGMNLIRKRRSV